MEARPQHWQIKPIYRAAFDTIVSAMRWSNGRSSAKIDCSCGWPEDTLRRVEVVRAVTDHYAAQTGIDLTSDHEALNLSMAFSLVASTGGVALMPLYASNLMPNSVVSRPIRGVPSVIDLVLGYSETGTSPLLKFLQSKVEDLKFRVSAPQSK
jgi:hypothetical protein